MQDILFFCSICLHLSNLGFQDLNLTQYRNSACKSCLNNLLDEPSINSYHKLNYPENVPQDTEISFDYRLLPLFRKTIDEAMKGVYVKTEEYDLSVPFPSSGLDKKAQMWISTYRRFFNILRETYSYENEIRQTFENQKNEVYHQISSEAARSPLRGRKRIDVVIQRKQKEAEFVLGSLVLNETMNTMKKYSKMIADSYIKFENFNNETEIGRVMEALELVKGSFKVSEGELSGRRMPGQSGGFNVVLQKFRITLEEILKEQNQNPNVYLDYEQLEERVKQRLLRQFHGDL